MEMCLTGRMMDATEAERANLVARVVPAAPMDEAMKTADARSPRCRFPPP
jgi:enoyl-CoA hydratase